MNHGYVMARVGQPKVTYIENAKAEGGKKPKKDMRLEIPVTEGEQFQVGEIKFEGLHGVEGGVGADALQAAAGGGLQRLEDQEGVRQASGRLRIAGVFPVDGVDEAASRPEKKVVDVTLSMDEDKRYYVGHINFTGNESTRDKVIRREVYLNESDVFNTELLKLSIKRINQLGYFKPMEGAPELASEREGGRQAGRDVQGSGAEPEPVHVRRRGVGAGGSVPERELPDRELPGPRARP